MTKWTSDDSADLYGIRRWGNGYFDVSDDGKLTVRVPGSEDAVALADILAGVRQRGLQLPMLLRIENLLDAQITRLNEAFRNAIRKQGYGGRYQGVFPIKVNQQRQVIEEITRFGAPFGHGLEAGSKAELVIALASLPADGSLVICNGYKDREFIDLGLRARQLGFRCIFVLETPAELPAILQRADELGVEPLLGVRIKLSTTVGGHWNLTSGDRSIFGLSISQLIEVVDQLRAAGRLDTLQLLHCHLGSQIPRLEDIRAAATEACRFYRELVQEGAAMGMIDFGGGLAVDYLGARSSDSQSRNYSLEEYAAALVETTQACLSDPASPHPTIITESGRETVAYYSLLLFDIFDVTRFQPADADLELPAEAHPLLVSMAERLDKLTPATIRQDYSAIVAARDQLQELFRAGQLSLRERATAQCLLLAAGNRALQLFGADHELPEELAHLRDDLSDIYYGNLSVFQSLPDHWAIGQLFPVAPIERLDEQPTRAATIADITCDSDGRIARFIDHHQSRATLPLHEIRDGESYVLGTFLVGAYQETLGDLHNLFGDTNVASVRIEPDGSFTITREDRGDRVADLLGYVQYDQRQLSEHFRATAEQAVRCGRIDLEQRQQIIASFTAGLEGYSYFES